MRFIDPDGMAPFDTTEEEEEEFDWEEFIKNLAADFINSDSEENVLTITFSDNDSNDAGSGDGGGCPEGVDCNERRLAPKRDFDSMDSSGYNSKYGLVDCECEGTMYQGVPGDGLIGIGNPFKIFQGLRALFAAKGVSVIGPRGTYRQFAKDIGGNFLNVTDDAWTWAKNEKFLAGVVKRGDDVVFAGKFNPAKLDPNSVLAREIKYLTERGYQWTNDFSKLIKK